MSYIRCGSNPESLYVFGNCFNQVELMWIDWNGEHRDVSCTNRQWFGLFRKIWKTWHGITFDPIHYGKNISVREAYYHFKTHSAIDSKRLNTLQERHMQASFDFGEKKISQASYQRIKKNCDTAILIELRIDDKSCFMWRTTWQYIYESVLATMGLKNKTPPD